VSSRRLLLRGIVAALTATALLAVGILLFGDFGETEGKILGTTAMLAGYGLLALPAGFLVDQRRFAWLAWAVLGLAAAGFAVAATTVWTEAGETLGKATLTVTVFAVAATQAAAQLAGRRTTRALFAASVALVLAVAVMASAAAWGEIDSSVYYRLLGAIAVLDVLVVALQPILAVGRRQRRAFALRVRLADGDWVSTSVEAADFAGAAAKALHAAQSNGGRPVAVELEQSD
jgi:hypothetical protein